MKTTLAICLLLGLPTLSHAQVFDGEAGACLFETANNDIINAGTCLRRAPNCTPTECTVDFYWQRDDFITRMTFPAALSPFQDAMTMNGQPVSAPAALVDSDPRQCVYNEVTNGLFCWMPGIDPFTIAAGDDVVKIQRDLMELVTMTAPSPTPLPAGGDHEEGEIVGVIEMLQGKYRPLPSWTCGVIGQDGGATAIQGNVLYGLENECTLENGRVVGPSGATVFDATCSAEGETYQTEFLLAADQWGSLAVITPDGVSLWENCDAG